MNSSMIDTLDLLAAMPYMLKIGCMVHYCSLCRQLIGYSKNTRWQRVYCSNACRQKAYRLRKRYQILRKTANKT